MSDKSAIEWTDATWNPTVGCSIVSPGCINCYAMKVAHGLERRFASKKYSGLTKLVNGNAVWTGEVRLDEEALLQPLKWRRGRRIFVNSMSDLFHESLPDEAIDRVFAVMALCPQHTFQVLTKRAARMRDCCLAADRVARIKAAIEAYGNSLGPDTEDFEFFGSIGWQSLLKPCHPDCKPPCACVQTLDDRGVRARGYDGPIGRDGALPYECHGKVGFDGPLAWPLPNVWLGVSTERQQEADERIPLLLQTPAAVRFISAEPLIGPIDLTQVPRADKIGADAIAVGRYRDEDRAWRDYPRLDWVIVGGESGPGARPMHIGWVRDLHDQCAAAGVAFFFKQWGEWRPRRGEREDIAPYCIAINGAISQGDKLEGGPEKRPRWIAIERVGKKAAGRLLDGKEHNEFPQSKIAQGIVA